MIYPIIHIKFTSPSFRWASGLYAHVSNSDTHMNICKLTADGTLQRSGDSDKLQLAVCGIGGANVITETNLKYNHS